MDKKDETEAFLREFKQKMKIWDVLFRDDRGVNAQTLADLEMRPIDRKAILENLAVEDYCQGPLDEKLYGGADLWVFGKEIKENEIYIKISIGFIRGSVLCISFHIAKEKMKYPFKKRSQ